MDKSETLVADVGIGLAAGMVATRTSAPIQEFLYRLTPQSVKRRENRVRPGSPTENAAKKLAARTGAKLNDKQLKTASSAIHYGSGLPWGAVYSLLRRHSGMTPVGAALATAASMWLILDESLTPAMGFSAPDYEYPIGTHIRGLGTHLLFGAVAGAAAEALYRLTGTGPRHRNRA